MSTELNLNPLQVQWLAESQIDYLWGQVFRAANHQPSVTAQSARTAALSAQTSSSVGALSVEDQNRVTETVQMSVSGTGGQKAALPQENATTSVTPSAPTSPLVSPAKTDIRHLMQQTGLVSASALVNKPIIPKETNLFYAPQLLALLQEYSAGEFKVEQPEPMDNPWNGAGVADAKLLIVDMVPSYQTTNVQLGLADRHQSLFQAIAYDLGWDIHRNLFLAHLSKSTLEDQENPDAYMQRCLQGLLDCLQQTQAQTLLIMGQSPQWFTAPSAVPADQMILLDRTVQVVIAPSPVQLLLNTQARQLAWNQYCQATTLAYKESLC